jgi:hypothetical protein
VDDAARIVVRRPEGGYRDLIRSYWIEIDGVRAGKVARGGQADFPVPPGVHDVMAVIDWTGSPSLRVEVADGETARLTVEPGGNAFQPWHLLTREGYLKLRLD